MTTNGRRPERARGLALAVGLSLSYLACHDAPPFSRDGSPRQMAAAPFKTRTQSIVAGAAAPEHSAVFYLEVTLPGGTATCTATLVTPDLLLTAAHCVTGQFGAVDCESTRLTAPLPLDAFRVSSEPDLTGAPQADWSFPELSDVRVVFEGEHLCGRDLALLRLETPVSPEVAVPLDVPHAGFERATTSPPEYRAIGYGAVHPSGTGERVRRVSEPLAVGCNSPDTCEAFMRPGAAGASAALPPSIELGEWIGTGSGCPGDSGGPALIETATAPEVVGVLSRGHSDCSLNIYTSPQSETFREAVRDMIQFHDSAPIYEIPSWVEEPTTPVSPDFPGGNGGAGGEPLTTDPPELGGAPVDAPNGPDRTSPDQDEEPGCSCRTSGPGGRNFSSPLAVVFAFVFLWGARRRSAGARAEGHR